MPPRTSRRPTSAVGKATRPIGNGGTAAGPATPLAATDGRQLRRARNREAVVEALLDLYRGGNLKPSAEEIAAHSGLSPRSLFRYFNDVDDLIRTAIAHQEAKLVPLVPVDAAPEAPLQTRIAALVEQRFRLFDAAGYAAAVVRMRAPFEPLVATTLARNREFLRLQMATLFAPELTEMGTSAGADALAAADVVTSFESRHLLIEDQGLTPAKAKVVMAGALSAILGSGG